MAEREKFLNENEKRALLSLVPELQKPVLRIDKKELVKNFNLTGLELERVIAVLGLVYHYTSREIKGSGINPRLKEKYAAQLINNPPGSRQIWEEKHGKTHIFKGYFPNGRNHRGRVR